MARIFWGRSLVYFVLVLLVVIGLEDVMSSFGIDRLAEYWRVFGVIALVVVACLAFGHARLGLRDWRERVRPSGRPGWWVVPYFLLWMTVGAWLRLRAWRPVEPGAAILATAGKPVPRVRFSDQLTNSFMENLLPGGMGQMLRAGEISEMTLVDGCRWHELDVGVVGLCRRKEGGAAVLVFHPASGGGSQLVDAEAVRALAHDGELAALDGRAPSTVQLALDVDAQAGAGAALAG